MKSAYELAMERLNSEEPQEKPLSEDQKKALAEIDEKYRAKAAEREIFLKQKLGDAISKGDMQEAGAIRKQISSEKRRIEDDCEAAKEKIRNEA
jgi:hypothetical protein